MKIGIISDIHEDIYNLEQAITILKQKGCNTILCLGDVVGFSKYSEPCNIKRDAAACVELVKQNCYVVLAGNHDLNAAKKLPKHKAGIDYPNNWFEMEYIEKAKKFKGKIWLYDDELPGNLKDEHIEYLRTLKEFQTVSFGGLNIFLSHFSYPDLSGSLARFVKQKEDAFEHLELIKKHNCKIGICGHGHTDGFGLLTNDSINIFDFGNYEIKDRLQCLFVPCVTNGRHKNGITILDTKQNQIQVIPLRNQSHTS